MGGQFQRAGEPEGSLLSFALLVTAPPESARRFAAPTRRNTATSGAPSVSWASSLFLRYFACKVSI